MLEKTIHIDLSLPRSWNQCTTEQLETIAACILKHTVLADRYHPFDWMDVKSELFFLLTETEIIRKEAPTHTPTDDPDPDAAATYICRQAQKGSLMSRLLPYHGNRQQPEFPLHAWQVLSWIDTQMKWLDDENSTLILFPYKHLVFTRHWQCRRPFIKKTFYAPAELLQDFTWQQYRHLQDYMSMYIEQQNTLVKTTSRRHNPEQIAAQQTALKSTRDEFLKVLFTPAAIAASQSLAASNAATVPGGSAAKKSAAKTAASIAKRASRITEIQWQVILLWWSGMMHYLKDHYPRCFRSTPTKKNSKRPPNPFDLYTSIITTIQDKAHIDEEKINSQTYTIVLEHLERIAKENEEIEKMNRKHK